jgi:anti-sigma factor RsiW
VLDQLSDADSVLEPKSTAQSGGVAGSTRHLTPEDLEAYGNGRLAPSRLDYCRTHLDSCDACRAELEDLRIFKSELSGFQRSEPDRRELERRKRRRRLTLPQAVSVATIVVVAGAAVFWWERGSLWRNKPSAAVSVGQLPVASAGSGAPTTLAASAASGATAAPAARTASAAPTAAPKRAAPPSPVAAQMQTRETRLADELNALPDDVRSAVSEAIQHGKLQLPTDVTRLRGRAPPLSGAPVANTGFALLGPFGEAISETRPEFSWQPLPGAIRYSVVIVDVGLHPVQRSPSLRKTAWRPRRPLRRDRTYLWQVTATLRGGSKVVASEPSPSETLLRIVPLKLADEMEHFRRGHEEAHLVLGALYAQAGMLTESADELRKVPPGDSSYYTAQTLLKSLSSANPGNTPRQSR